MTLIDLFVVIACLAVLAAMLLPILAGPKHHTRGINCVSNLKQINLAFRIWEGDNNNQYPMAVSVTNGGAMELISTGNVAVCFQAASNELSTTKILVCPQDNDRTSAINFETLDASHISYFIGPDANEDHPQMILDGDDNIALNSSPVKSGIVQVSTNAIAWGPGRHGDTDIPHHFWTPPPRHFVGNLGFADGSVAEVNDSGLQQALQQTGLATNRLAIP